MSRSQLRRTSFRDHGRQTLQASIASTRRNKSKRGQGMRLPLLSRYPCTPPLPGDCGTVVSVDAGDGAEAARAGTGDVGTTGAEELFIPLDPKGVNDFSAKPESIDPIDFWGDLNFGKKISAIGF